MPILRHVALVALVVTLAAHERPALGQPSQFVGLFPLTTATLPVGVVAAGDGSGRLFIVQQTGQIRVWTGTQLLAAPFLDIGGAGGLSTNCDAAGCGERGLLGLAFHPSYATNGFFYAYYTRQSDGDIVVARYAVSGDANVANTASAMVLLTIEHSSQTNHNGGALAFGPDGYLYVATGDGGGGGDPFENGQSMSALLGKVLRLDVNGDDFPGDAGRNYAVPSTNPFVGTAGADEIWAYGLRNPWRISFDRSTGDLWIGDVGQNMWEEVDFQPASSSGGENYGWDCREGAHNYSDTNGDMNVSCGSVASIDPVLEHDHSPECSITGGHVFRNLSSHFLTGQFFYGDFCSGEIWRGFETATPGVWNSAALGSIANTFGLTSFGEGETGRIYVAYSSGAVQWLQPYTFADVLPTRWSWPSVEAIHDAGMTAGCSASPRSFCPTSSVTRAEMAVFLGRQIHGAAFTPPPATGVFADVPTSHWAAAWVEQLYADGVTAGCAVSPLRFCPEDPVMRDQMAIFLLTAKHGNGYAPPPATGTVFADVSGGTFAAAWIEQLHAEGMTAGCATSPLRFCPGDSVVREQMAVFLARGAELDLP